MNYENGGARKPHRLTIAVALLGVLLVALHAGTAEEHLLALARRQLAADGLVDQVQAANVLLHLELVLRLRSATRQAGLEAADAVQLGALTLLHDVGDDLRQRL